MALLEIKNLGIAFGGLKAVDDLNLSVEKGQLYGLIGPNGAGKRQQFLTLSQGYINRLRGSFFSTVKTLPANPLWRYQERVSREPFRT